MSTVCTCGARNGYSSLGHPGHFVCADCRLPSRMFILNLYERIGKMPLAPRGAVAALSSHSRQDGIAEVRWAMPDGTKVMTFEYYPFDRKQTDMGAGPTLLQRTWAHADAELDALFSNPTDSEYHKYRTRMACEILAMFMVPHFTTADEVGQELMRRRDARLAGDETYETKGLGSLAFVPPPGEVKYGTPGGKAAAAKKAPTKVAGLQPQQQEFVRKALADGALDAETLAGMFKVPVDTIKACVQ